MENLFYRIICTKHLAQFSEFTFWGSVPELEEQITALLDAGYTEISWSRS